MNVRRQKIYDALTWLIQNNPLYSNVQIDHEALNTLPNNGVPSSILTVETDDNIVTDN